MDPRLVIIDCDTGLDDAWAVAALVQSEAACNLKLLAITCCDGNTTIDNSSVNNLLLLQTMNRLDVSGWSK